MIELLLFLLIGVLIALVFIGFILGGFVSYLLLYYFNKKYKVLNYNVYVIVGSFFLGIVFNIHIL